MPFRLTSTALLAALTVLFTVGCSQDKNVYYSSEYSPKTITVIDVADRTELWRYELPVGQRLTTQFNSYDSEVPGGYPTEMSWETHEYSSALTLHNLGGKGESVDNGLVDLPGRSVTTIVSVRETPEFAPTDDGLMLSEDDNEPLPVPDVDIDAEDAPEEAVEEAPAG